VGGRRGVGGNGGDRGKGGEMTQTLYAHMNKRNKKTKKKKSICCLGSCKPSKYLLMFYFLFYVYDS
jgi:hypothetical protein